MIGLWVYVVNRTRPFTCADRKAEHLTVPNDIRILMCVANVRTDFQWNNDVLSARMVFGKPGVWGSGSRDRLFLSGLSREEGAGDFPP